MKWIFTHHAADRLLEYYPNIEDFAEWFSKHAQTAMYSKIKTPRGDPIYTFDGNVRAVVKHEPGQRVVVTVLPPEEVFDLDWVRSEYEDIERASEIAKASIVEEDVFDEAEFAPSPRHCKHGHVLYEEHLRKIQKLKAQVQSMHTLMLIERRRRSRAEKALRLLLNNVRIRPSILDELASLAEGLSSSVVKRVSKLKGGSDA
jgi:hypothetical protein